MTWLITIKKNIQMEYTDGKDKFVCQTYAEDINQIVFLIHLFTHSKYCITIDMQAGKDKYNV